MNLKTIAKEAGVSVATVSNVINGNHHKVSQETILKVQKIIKDNDYKPNATARSLASKESKIIGVVIPNISEEGDFFVNPHNAHILALLENYIRKQGYYLMVRCVGKSKEIVPLFSSWNVDGMIMFGTFKEEIEHIRKRLNVPTVYIDTYADEIKIANVGIDDYKGGYLGAKYLIDKGHKEIAFVGPSIKRAGVIQQRYQGFYEACAEQDIQVTVKHIFEADTLYEKGIVAGQKIAQSNIPFTAVVVMSDIVAFGVMEGLKQCGLYTPNDVSVIGFDDLPECCYSNPKLTTISQNVVKKALLVGEYLFKMIRQKEMIVVNKKVEVQVVERESVKELKS